MVQIYVLISNFPNILEKKRVLRVAVLQLELRGWGMVMVVPIFIYINIEVNNGVRWVGTNCSAVARSGRIFFSKKMPRDS